LTLRDYQSTLAAAKASADASKVVRPQTATIDTSLQLQAIMPVSPEEAAQATTAVKK
jgi:type IV pilus assembly protein PilO